MSVSQIALAVLLLSGAALIGLSLHMMVEHDPGFKTSQLVVAHLNPHGPTYGSKARKRQVWRALLKRVMPDESFTEIASMQQYIRHSAQGTSAVGLILAACGIIALMLASTGTYGIIAQLSRIRRREFAIRIALGATPVQIEWLVLRTGLALWIIGSATGVGLAIAGGLMFRDHLYKVSALDPGPHTACAVIIGLIVLFASWFPARLTSRIDPSEVLQSE